MRAKLILVFLTIIISGCASSQNYSTAVQPIGKTLTGSVGSVILKINNAAPSPKSSIGRVGPLARGAAVALGSGASNPILALAAGLNAGAQEYQETQAEQATLQLLNAGVTGVEKDDEFTEVRIISVDNGNIFTISVDDFNAQNNSYYNNETQPKRHSTIAIDFYKTKTFPINGFVIKFIRFDGVNLSYVIDRQ